MSSVTIAVTLLDLIAASASCITQDTKSIAERPGSAQNSCGCTTLYFIANQDICFATSRSNPLPKLERREISLQPFGLVRSRPVFGSSTTSATLNGVGKYSKSKHAWKRSLICGPIVLQQAFRSRTVILSCPGAVSLLPIVAAVTSFSVTWPSHGI